MPRHFKQEQFKGKGLKKPNPCFGGSLLRGNPKGKRPLESKLPIHLVLRARKGGLRQAKIFGKIHEIVYDSAQKHGITIYEYANVGNHLHILIKIARVSRWAGFIRELTGRIALLARTIVQLPEGASFWLHRPFTRIVQSWKTAYRKAKQYVQLNWLEAEGFINRKETKTLRDLRRLIGAYG